MNIKEAREIIKTGKFLRPIYSKYSVAEGFIEGYEQWEERVKSLVRALERTKQLTMGPSLETQDSIMCEVIEALSKFKGEE